MLSQGPFPVPRTAFMGATASFSSFTVWGLESSGPMPNCVGP